MDEYYIVRDPQPFGGMPGSYQWQGFPMAQDPGYFQAQDPGATVAQGPDGFPGGGPGGFPGGAPGGFPGGGPGGFPGGGPGGFPGGGPGGFPGGGPGGGPPSGRPPAFIPSQATATQAAPLGAGAFAVNPGSIRPCLFRFTYIWLVNGQQFWMWPVFIGRDSISGWRWTGFRWVFFGTDLRRIAAFTCF